MAQHNRILNFYICEQCRMYFDPIKKEKKFHIDYTMIKNSTHTNTVFGVPESRVTANKNEIRSDLIGPYSQPVLLL